MSNTRMVTLFWFGATIVVGVFFQNVLTDFVFHYLHLNNPTVLFDWSLTFVLGYALAIGVGVGTYLQPRVRELAFEVAAELGKTSWPTRNEVQTQTVAVIVTAAVCAGILGVFDAVGSKVMTGWLPQFIGWVAKGLH
jgi:preprotein translocase subunit SecE